jgi:anti-sigma B factor antagonist
MDELDVHIHEVGPFDVVAVTGEIDVASVDMLRDRVLPLVGKPEPRLIIDLSGVTFMDSTGLSLLVAVRRRLPDGAPLLIVGAAPQIARLFQITSLNKVFPLFDSVDEATSVT